MKKKQKNMVQIKYEVKTFFIPSFRLSSDPVIFIKAKNIVNRAYFPVFMLLSKKKQDKSDLLKTYFIPLYKTIEITTLIVNRGRNHITESSVTSRICFSVFALEKIEKLCFNAECYFFFTLLDENKIITEKIMRENC